MFQGNLGGSYCLVYCGDGLESEITECLCGKFCKWTTGKPVCYDPADYEYSIYGEEYEQEPMPEAKVKNIFEFSASQIFGLILTLTLAGDLC